MNEENYKQQELFEQRKYISDLIEKRETIYQTFEHLFKNHI